MLHKNAFSQGILCWRERCHISANAAFNYQHLNYAQFIMSGFANYFSSDLPATSVSMSNLLFNNSCKRVGLLLISDIIANLEASVAFKIFNLFLDSPNKWKMG